MSDDIKKDPAGRLRLAHNAYKRQLTELRRLETESARLEASVLELQRLAAEAEDEKDRVLENFARGRVEQLAVSQARAAATSALERVEEAREMLHAIKRGAKRIQPELSDALREYGTARVDFCLAAVAPIEEKLRSDQKLRRALVDIFAAICAVRAEGVNSGIRADWHGVFSDVFTPPDDAELAEAVARFETQHLNPLLSGAS